MRIGIDIDDVLADFNQGFNQFLEERYGVSVIREQWSDYHIHNTLKWTKKKSDQAIHEFNASPYLRGLVPVAGAQIAITDLRKHHQLILITARAEENHPETAGFLNEHYGDVFHGLHYTNHARHDGSEISKSVVCLKEKVEILIEDGSHNAFECAEAGIPIYLFDTPWNRTAPAHPLITRVHSWEEICTRLMPGDGEN